MLATHAPLLPLHSSATPTAKPCLLSGSRSALADSTNVNSRSNVCGPGYPKTFVYPTSSARASCGWNDLEYSTGYIPTSCHSHNHPLSSTPSLFPVTCKAPPTVCISLSAACSQSIPGDSRVHSLEPDLLDVRSVVPFPSTPSDGDMDVDMLDGTCVPCPNGHLPPASQAPRKRRSAHTSVSSPQGSLGKDTKLKRPRKSRRQVAELWWLSVIHRSILHGIKGRQSVGELDTSDRLSSGLRDFDAMDRVLVEKIQKRLAANGCVEGRALPNPLPRISSPTISVPSLNLLAPSSKTAPTDSVPGNSNLDGTGSSMPASKAPLMPFILDYFLFPYLYIHVLQTPRSFRDPKTTPSNSTRSEHSSTLTLPAYTNGDSPC
ncbi:hypothetical protein J3R83DRAFT_1431 [Lanmaoa asiatica]|nr:hypothetical protein J3R83DRAFT_1431 [Lanmaoa asiatica]